MMAISLLVAIFLVLVYKQYIILPQDYYAWACLPLAGALTLTGLLLIFWEPYNLPKVKFYACIYTLIAALTSTLVVGYSSFTYLCWLLLIGTTGVYLPRLGTLLGYGGLLASMATWVIIHPDVQNFSDVFTLAASAVVLGVTVFILISILQLTNKSIKNLEVSHEKEDFEHGQLTSLINSMADGVIAVDEQANVILYNAAALNVLDINSSMQGASIGRFLKPVTGENASIDIVNLVQNTHTPTTNRDLRIKYSDGSFANLYLAIAPVHLGYGKTGVHGFVLLLRDITHEKSLEEERDEFISVVSHELRTPIAISEGNISNAQVIVDRNGDMASVKTALEEAHNQVIFLADMINDLATLSRAERGKLTMELEQIPINEFVAELTHNYTADAEKKGLELRTSVEEGVAPLSSSKLYVREVLQNFITNAIKYTDSGSVTLTAKPTDDGVLFTVQDTGIGISKADQERVFDKFFRSEDFRTRQHNGTGLGLYVTMKLAKIIHAQISLESELNKGSTFSIVIPNIHETPKAAEATPAEATSESHASPAA